MAVTNVDVQAVTSALDEADKELNQQADAMKSISQQILFMEDAWESDAQLAYANAFRADSAKIETFNRSLAEALQTMRRFVNDCVETDAVVGGELSGIEW